MKKALFVALWVTIGITAMAQITLNFTPDKGSKYRYHMEMAQKINQTVMGQKMDMDQMIIMAYDMDVLEKTGTETKIQFEYKEVVYNLSSAMMNMNYDSRTNATPANAIDEMMAKIFSSLLNKKFELVMTPDGSVKSVTGMKAILDDMMKAIGNDAGAQQVAQQMAQQFGDDAMKASFEQTFKIYPGKAIKPGDSWNVNQNLGASGMNMNVNTTYTLKSADATKAYTNVKSTIDGMNGQIKGTQEGTAEFDIQSGLPVASNITQKASGTVSAQGMEIPLDLNATVKVSVTKVK